MKEKLLLLFSRETVEVLTLVGQLGIFNIFIGGTYFTPSPALFHSISNEWAGLVGQYRMKLQPGSWWILLFPLTGFVLLLLSFYLISRGLEKSVRERYRGI
jgi:peptide/nickel transport system permease protein